MDTLETHLCYLNNKSIANLVIYPLFKLAIKASSLVIQDSMDKEFSTFSFRISHLTAMFPKGTIIEKYHNRKVCIKLLDEMKLLYTDASKWKEFLIQPFVRDCPNYTYLSLTNNSDWEKSLSST